MQIDKDKFYFKNGDPDAEGMARLLIGRNILTLDNVTYKDVFDEKHQTLACFVCISDWFGPASDSEPKRHRLFNLSI